MQQSNVRPDTHRPIVIEVAGEPVGVVVPHEDRFRFLAVKLPAFAIDGLVFENPDLAREAAAEATALHAG